MVAERQFYQGVALQAVDDKGRVAIPADIRTVLERNSPERTIIVAKHPDDPCLTAHDTAWTQIKGERLDRRLEKALDDGKQVDGRAKRNVHGQNERANFDSSARFILPGYYRERVGIERWACFVGAGDEFEIWAPEILVATPSVDEEIQRLCRYHCKQRGVAL